MQILQTRLMMLVKPVDVRAVAGSSGFTGDELTR